jgi:hypothetical protein
MGTFISWIDILQAMTQSTQEEMEANMNIRQAKMEATIHSIRSELEEAIKHQVRDVLSCVDQKTQGLREEVTETTDETWVNLQPIQTSSIHGQRAFWKS